MGFGVATVCALPALFRTSDLGSLFLFSVFHFGSLGFGVPALPLEARTGGISHVVLKRNDSNNEFVPVRGGSVHMTVGIPTVICTHMQTGTQSRSAVRWKTIFTTGFTMDEVD